MLTLIGFPNCAEIMVRLSWLDSLPYAPEAGLPATKLLIRPRDADPSLRKEAAVPAAAFWVNSMKETRAACSMGKQCPNSVRWVPLAHTDYFIRADMFTVAHSTCGLLSGIQNRSTSATSCGMGVLSAESAQSRQSLIIVVMTRSCL